MNEDFLSMLKERNELTPFLDVIEQIISIPDEQLTPESIDIVAGMIKGAFTDKVIEEAIDASVRNFREQNASKSQVADLTTSLKQGFTDLIDEIKPTEEKKILLKTIFEVFTDIADQVQERFLQYDLVLPVKIEGNGQLPTYAHFTDAAADIYASEDTNVPAHSMATKIPTGLYIALPEHWVAYVIPRSSIGSKTPLRLSNSVGCIDADYRGEIGVLYDNISDSDYQIHAGERIAQLIVMPCYHFNARKVDILPATERGEGGFGSTGK